MVISGTHQGMSSIISRNKRLVGFSIGLACTLSISTKAARADEAVPVTDPTAHTTSLPDPSLHVNSVDPVLNAVDPAANINVIDIPQPVMPVEATIPVVPIDPVQNMMPDPTAHLNIVDPTQNIMPDPTAHLNIVDPTQNIAPDPTAHLNVVDPTQLDPTQGLAADPIQTPPGNTDIGADNTQTVQHQMETAGALHSAQAADAIAATTTQAPTPADLNLSATTQDFLAGSLGNFHTLTIDVGGVKETVDIHSRLTAAEFVAADQVLNDGGQTITLGAHGEATGGYFFLDTSLLSAFNGQIGDLTVTQGVQLINTFDMVHLAGDINNYGSILMASTTAGQSDTISANAIINSFEGLIGSYTGGLNGLFSADPILNALTSFTNFGTISSAGSLTISAPEIYNLSSGDHTATISAAQNINLDTTHLVNSGDISAALGNINATSTGSLALDGFGGTLSAENGYINLLSNNDALQVMGGNFVSKELTLKAGHSTANLQAQKVSGVVNASGDNVHLYTSESDLHLGNIDAAGDPTLASQANIIIDGTIAPTSGANLAIISGQNILSGAGGQLDTRNLNPGGGNGGNLSLIAGANFTVDGSGNVVLTDSANANKGSVTGGAIDLTGAFGGSGPINLITTAGTGATGNAGYIQMVAYAGTSNAPFAGTINIPSAVTLDASSASGQRGDISIIAGSNGAPSLTSGSMVGRNITLLNQTPTVGAGMFFDGTGTASNGINSFSALSGIKTSTTQIQGNLSATGNINATAGRFQTVGNINADGAGGIDAPGLMNGENGHNITITSFFGTSIQGNITATGGGGAGSGSATSTLAGGAGGNGGLVTLASNGNLGGLSITGNVNVSGGGGGGGAGGSQTSAATAGGAGGQAGTFKATTSVGGVNVGGTVYAYDGGAGGAGGSSSTGVGAGGGGGSSYGGAGGGGGGGTGNLATDFAAGGGGGFSIFGNGGGGGGGVFGNPGSGTLSTGGSGGSVMDVGLGGTGDVAGGSAVATIGGLGGGIASPAVGGAGATIATIGGAGGGTNIATEGIGSTGSGARVVTGHGLVDILGGASGNGPGGALRIEAGALRANGSQQNSQVKIADFAGVPLDLISFGGLNGAATLTTTQNAGTTGADGTINVIGAVSGQAFNITTNGDAGPNNINIYGTVGSSSQNFGTVLGNLTSNGGTITTFGAGSINSFGGTVTATGDINVKTSSGLPTGFFSPGLGVVSTNGNVTINQGTGSLHLNNSSVVNGGTLTLHAQGPLLIGNNTANGGTINIDTSGSNSSISLNGPITTGNTGSVTIQTLGSGSILQTSQATAGIVSSNINLITNGNIGSSTAPVVTTTVNNAPINTTYGAASSIFLRELSTGVVTVNAPTASSGTLSVTAQGSQINVPQANFNNVSITNTNANGTVLLNSGNNPAAILGNGAGTFAVTAGGNIEANANNTNIQGTSVSLVSNNGSIGTLRRITAAAPTLTVRALNGSVDVETPNATTINGGAANNFHLIDTVSGQTVTLNGPLTANVIDVQAPNAGNLAVAGSIGANNTSILSLLSGGGISFNPSAVVTAQDLSLTAGNNQIAVGNGLVLSNLHWTPASGVISIAAAAAPGGTDQINFGGGDFEILSNLLDTNSLVLTAGGTLTVGSSSNSSVNVAANNLTLSAQAIANYGTAQATNALTVNSSGAAGVTNNAGATMSAGAQLAINALSGGAFTNAGAMTANQLAAFSSGIVNSGTIQTSGNQELVAYGAAGVTNTASGSLTSDQNLTVSGTAGQSPINNAGTITAANTLLLQTLNSSVTNSSTGNISSSDVAEIQAETITNDGSVFANNALTLTTPTSNPNPSANLAINGSGTFSLGNSGALSFRAPGDITVLGNLFTTLNSLGSFNVDAGGTFNNPFTSVAASNAGSGGTININAGNWVYNGTTPITTPISLVADGDAGPNTSGGTITLNLTNSAAQGITIGGAAGNFSLSAGGWNGGQATVNTPGSLTVDTAYFNVKPTSSAGTGGNVFLTAGNNLLLKGSLDTHFGTSGYGVVSLTSGSAAPFLIDGTKTNTLNGQIGISNGQGIFGSDVTINNQGGVELARNYKLTGVDSLTINGSGLTNNGVVDANNIAINAVGTGSLTTGTFGSYQNTAMDSLTLNSQSGGFNLSGTLPRANQININAQNGTVAFAPSSSNLTATADAGGNGGNINIAATNLTSGALALNAAATTGNGGNVNLQLTGNSPVNIGSGALSINVANAAGMQGGSVVVSTGGGIKANANSLNLGGNYAPGTGNGASLQLISGGKLFLDRINTLPASLRDLQLISNSATAFSLGGASSNGNGIGSENRNIVAENIVISNQGGAIVVGDGRDIVGQTVSLLAQDNIGSSNKHVNVSTASSLTLNSNAGSAFVNLKNTTATDLSASAANTLDLTSPGSLNVLGPINSQTLVLDVNGVNALETSATSITASTGSGDLYINNTSASAPLTVDGLSAPGSVTLLTGSDLTTTDTISAGTNVLLTASGGMVIGKNVNAQNGTAELYAYGGNLTNAGNGSYRVNADQVNLFAGGAIGSAALPFRTGAANITLNGGDVYLANRTTSSTAVTNLLTSNVGSLNFTQTNTNANNQGTLNIDSISATSGPIYIGSNEKVLAVNPYASITTSNGNITLLNTYQKNGSNLPSIQIGDGAFIYGSSFGSPDTGNVYIALGSVPSTADLRPGVAPTANSPVIEGTVYFGTRQNPTGSITTGTNNYLAGLDRNLVFNTNKLAASQISLGNDVTIIADPPLAPGQTGADFGTLQYVNASAADSAGTAMATAFTANTATAPGTAGTGNLPSTMPLAALSPVGSPSANTFGLGQSTQSSQSSVSDVSLPSISATLAAALNSPVPTAELFDTPAQRLANLNSRAASKASAVNSSVVEAAQAWAEKAFKLSQEASTKAMNGSTAISAQKPGAEIGTVETLTKETTTQNPSQNLNGTKLSGGVSNAVRRSIQKGALLMAPDANTIIDTPYGSVAVKAGSVALLIAFDRGLAVYDLHDNRKGDVSLTSGSHSMALLPGRTAVLTNTAIKEFGDVNPIKFVGYRQMVTRDVSAQTRLFHGEFEILSMVRGLKPLGNLVTSDNAKARKTLDNMLKTAAILLELNHGGEQYKYHMPKELLAYMASRKGH